MLRAARRLSSWQAGVEIDSRRRAGRPPDAGGGQAGRVAGSEHVSDELAAALVLTGRSADVLLGLARDLVRLPAVLGALLAGRIDRARAEIFASRARRAERPAGGRGRDGVLAQAGSMTTGQLRAALRSMVLYLAPAGAAPPGREGPRGCPRGAWQEGSGNAALAGRELPPAEMIAADERISAIARALKEAGATGTMDQLRAAVFAALLAGRDPESLLPEPAPRTSAGREVPAGGAAAGRRDGRADRVGAPDDASLGLAGPIPLAGRDRRPGSAGRLDLPRSGRPPLGRSGNPVVRHPDRPGRHGGRPRLRSRRPRRRTRPRPRTPTRPAARPRIAAPLTGIEEPPGSRSSPRLAAARNAAWLAGLSSPGWSAARALTRARAPGTGRRATAPRAGRSPAPDLRLPRLPPIRPVAATSTTRGHSTRAAEPASATSSRFAEGTTRRSRRQAGNSPSPGLAF